MYKKSTFYFIYTFFCRLLGKKAQIYPGEVINISFARFIKQQVSVCCYLKDAGIRFKSLLKQFEAFGRFSETVKSERLHKQTVQAVFSAEVILKHQKVR